QPLFYLLEGPGFNDILPGLVLKSVGEHLVLPAEVRRQERVDEGNIVMDAPDLKYFLPAETQLLVPGPPLLQVVALLPLLAELPGVPAVLDVAEKLDAQLVRVEPGAVGGHRAGVVVGVVDALPRL